MWIRLYIAASCDMAGIIGCIGPFDDSTEQWFSYTERFDCFVQANGIAAGKLVSTFLSVVGPKMFNLLRCLVQLEKPASLRYREIVDALAAHFSPKALLIAERFCFHKSNQEEGESVTCFVFLAALRKLAEHCEFNNVLNDTIRNRLVCGLRSEAAQKRLLTESALTLEKAIEISVSMELAAKESQQLNSSVKIHKVSTESREAPIKCYWCDKTGHLAVECWSKDVNCRKYGKKGHIECACRTKRTDKQSKNSQRPRHSFKKRVAVHNMQQGHPTTEGSSSSDEAAAYV